MGKNNSELIEGQSKNEYDVISFYESSWRLVKNNLRPLALVTALGIIVNILVTIAFWYVIVQNIEDGISSAVITGSVSIAISIIASMFVYLLQLIAIRRVQNNKPLVISEVSREAIGFVPRALGYSFFIAGAVIASVAVITLLAAATAGIGAILYLLLIPLIIIAAFRYAFVPYLIIEDKKQGFLERFQTSRKLTEGIYGKIFLAGVIAVVLGIAVGIITSLLSTPFQNKAVTNNSYTSNQIKFGEIENERDFRRALKQNTENALTSGNIIATIIQETGSAAMGIIVLGAMLELYRRRKEDLNI